METSQRDIVRHDIMWCLTFVREQPSDRNIEEIYGRNSIVLSRWGQLTWHFAGLIMGTWIADCILGNIFGLEEFKNSVNDRNNN